VKSYLFVAAALLIAAPASAQTVVIDPGHGGADPGAVGCAGLEEAPSVLDIAQQARSVLEAEGLRVEMTRDDDRAVGLSARAAFANDLGATLFVSIHSNANGGTPATGTETWIANSASATSVTLAELLQGELITEWMLRDRGVKRANFAVLTGTRMPAALTEVCFTNRCDPDAALLRDPVSRAGMGAAHARAILLALDRDPPPPGTDGTLLGVVFEDVGVGLEDTSNRVGTASVTVDGVTMAVASDTGAWSFVLAPGDHTVMASAPGYEPASRTCAVTAGADTWCSVGVVPTSAEVDAGVIVAPDAGAATDAGGPTDAGGAADAGAVTPPDDGGCSCRVGNRSGGGAGWLLLVVGLALWRARRARRRVGALGLLAAGLLLAVACAEPASVAAPLDEVAPESPGAPTIDARIVAPFATLGPARPVAEGLVAPVLSPDGRRVAMSERGLDRLHVADLSTGQLELVAEGARVGVSPWWSADSSTLRVRHAQQSSTAVPHQAIALDGDPAPAPRASAHVWLDDRRRVVLRESGGAPRVISPDGDRYLTPLLTADARHVVLWGMSTGLFAYRLDDGGLVRLGEGAHPSVGPQGRWLVFERSADDGHAVVRSELWITDLDDPAYRTGPLTDTADAIERTPSVAAGRVAWATPEGVLVADLRVD